MRLPRSFVIKGSRWGVKTRAQGRLFDDDGNAVLGLCDYENKTIWVERGHSKEMTADILLHEFIHASAEELHLQLSRSQDEILALGLTQCLLQCFEIHPKRRRTER